MLVKKRRELLILLFVLTGLIAGLILPEIFKMGTGSYSGFFSMYSFQKYETADIRPWDIFPYLLESRLKTLLFLWMSCFTAAGVLFHLMYVWWLAAAGGMLFALFSLREGTRGILSFACCLFPQWILYAAMLKCEIIFLLSRKNIGSAVYDLEISESARSANWNKNDLVNSNLYGNRRKRALLELGQMIVLCMAGCACEAFLGTWTLKIFLQYFS